MDVTVVAGTFNAGHVAEVNTYLDEMTNGKQITRDFTPNPGSLWASTVGNTDVVSVGKPELLHMRRMLAVATQAAIGDISMDMNDYIKATLILGL